MNHLELMGSGHAVLMLLLWVVVLGAVFALGYFAGYAKGRNQHDRDSQV